MNQKLSANYVISEYYCSKNNSSWSRLMEKGNTLNLETNNILKDDGGCTMTYTYKDGAINIINPTFVIDNELITDRNIDVEEKIFSVDKIIHYRASNTTNLFDFSSLRSPLFFDETVASFSDEIEKLSILHKIFLYLF